MSPSPPEIIIIAAMASNRVIGRNNTLPWHLPSDLRRFRQLTMGHVVIMGRNTYESIGHPLAGRRNIVLTRTMLTPPGNIEIATSLQRALHLARSADKCFIIGGEQVYGEAISFADTLILTILDRSFAGDTFFPLFSSNDYRLVSSRPYSEEPTHRVEIWKRKKKWK